MTQTLTPAKPAVSDSFFDIDDILGDALAPSPKPAEEKKADAVVSADPAAVQFSKRLRAPALPTTLYFDLETIPDYSREAWFDLPPVPAPAVYAAENDGPTPSELIKETIEDVKATVAKFNGGEKKLPRVILEGAIAVEKKRPKPRKGVIDVFADLISMIDNEAATIQAAIDANRKTMSVTPEMCRICSFGWAMGDEVPMASVFGEKGGTKDHDTYERAVLKKFWELAKRAKLIVGYNHLGFDLPVIYVRSAMLGVMPTRMIDFKPWGGEVCDLMQARWPRGGQKKLKDFARLMGLPIPAGDVDGSQVEVLLKTDPFKVGEYNRSDVSITRELHLAFRGLFW
jgi:hypothetical protein